MSAFFKSFVPLTCDMSTLCVLHVPCHVLDAICADCDACHLQLQPILADDVHAFLQSLLLDPLLHCISSASLHIIEYQCTNMM